MKVTVYRDKSGEYCWKLAAENGEIVADSAEGCKLKLRKAQSTRAVP